MAVKTRAARLAVAAAVVLTTVAAAGPAHATTVTDGFEAGSPTVFNPNGATQDCTIRQAGTCSLKLFPNVRSQYVGATTPVGLPIQGLTTVSFYLYNQSTSGDVDSDVNIVLDSGHRVVLHTTAYYNNQVSLLSATGHHNIFSSWSAGVWTPITLVFDPANKTVKATVNGQSAQVTYPSGTTIDRVEWYGVAWGSGTPVRYDSLKVENTPPPVLNTAPYTMLGSPADHGVLKPTGPYTFTASAIDFEGDQTVTHFQIYNTKTRVYTEVDGPLVANGAPVEVTVASLPLGDYTWWAYSVDSRGKTGEPTAVRHFSVRHLSYDEGIYVGLGDSYSSGEGAPPYDPGTDTGDNTCHRGAGAWQRLVSQSPYAPKGGFEFYACSGAETRANLMDEYFKTEPPQISHVNPDKEITLVTLSIGGNDAGFAQVLTDCFFVPACQIQDELFVDARLDRLDGGPANRYTEHIRPLAEVYETIKTQAPRARIVVMGYPKLFKEGFTDAPWCDAWGVSERKWMNAKAAELNAIIKKNALAKGLEYADVEHAMDGHRICDDDPWIHGFVYDGDITKPHPWSFHPNAAGHQAEARIVEDLLSRPPAGQQKQTVTQGSSWFSKFLVGPILPPRITFNIGWPGSDVELKLHSPSGRVIDRSTVAADVTRLTGATYETVSVTNPEAGEWTAEMVGLEIAPGGEEVTLTVATEDPANAPPVASATAGLVRNTLTVDASASSDSDGTVAEYLWDFGDGTPEVSGATATHHYAAPGQYTASLLVVDDDGATDVMSIPVDVQPYQFGGFTSPINAAPTLNKVTAGRTIPVKWHLADAGADVSDPASFVSVTSVAVPCDADAPVDVLEETGTTVAGLKYTGDGWWNYTWSTDKAWAGTCRRMTLRLADGATAGRSVLFDFR